MAEIHFTLGPDKALDLYKKAEFDQWKALWNTSSWVLHDRSERDREMALIVDDRERIKRDEELKAMIERAIADGRHSLNPGPWPIYHTGTVSVPSVAPPGIVSPYGIKTPFWSVPVPTFEWQPLAIGRMNESLRWRVAEALGWVVQVDRSEAEAGVSVATTLVLGQFVYQLIDANRTGALALAPFLPAWEASPLSLRRLVTWLSETMGDVSFYNVPYDDGTRVSIDDGLMPDEVPRVVWHAGYGRLERSLADLIQLPNGSIMMRKQAANRNESFVTPSLATAALAAIWDMMVGLQTEMGSHRWLDSIRQLSPDYLPIGDNGSVPIDTRRCFCGSGDFVNDCQCMSYWSIIQLQLNQKGAE